MGGSLGMGHRAFGIGAGRSLVSLGRRDHYWGFNQSESFDAVERWFGLVLSERDNPRVTGVLPVLHSSASGARWLLPSVSVPVFQQD